MPEPRVSGWIRQSRFLGILLAIASSSLAQGGRVGVTVQGTVYDSLRGAPLANAVIVLDGASGGRQAIADSRGRFRIDSVSAGTHSFSVLHEVLDSIGFSGLSARATITDGRDEVTIAVPSFATLWRAACGPGKPPRDSGFVYGVVRDGTGGRPVAGATVDMTWLELGVDRERMLSGRRWRAQSRSDASGSYGVCGVPMDIGLRVQAKTDSLASGLIDLSPPDGTSPVRVRRRDLMVGPLVGRDSGRRGTIVGLLTDMTTGEPFRDARVVMDEAPEARTGDDGRFVIRGVPAGTRQLEVLSIGMKPVTILVDVLANDTSTVTATLQKITTLDVVRVTGSVRQRVFLRDFQDRQKTGLGLSADSTLVGNAGTIGGALAAFTGVEVRTGTGEMSVTLPAQPGRCDAVIWIDGVKGETQDLGMVRPSEIAFLEVFPHKLTVPVEFMRRGEMCGAIVLWTKQWLRR